MSQVMTAMAGQRGEGPDEDGPGTAKRGDVEPGGAALSAEAELRQAALSAGKGEIEKTAGKRHSQAAAGTKKGEVNPGELGFRRHWSF